jgi:PhnB protein
MSLSLAPYLNFPGNTREAMGFYQSIFGGDLTVSTFGEYGMEPADGTMHAQLQHESFVLMASDAMPGAEDTWGGTRVYLSLVGDDVETSTAWFTALAEGGSIGMPLEKQVWGDVYGILKDKYGLEWMFNISSPQ